MGIDATSVYAPDVLWYREERRIRDFYKRPQPLPDIAVETIIVFRRSSADAPRFDVSLELAPPETLSSPLPPGFALPMANVFDLR